MDFEGQDVERVDVILRPCEVFGKEIDAAEAVVSDIGADGNARAGRSGDAIADDVVVLAVSTLTPRRRSSNTATTSRARSSWTSRTRSTKPLTGSSPLLTALRPRS
jgi:hypothetical protein